MTVYDKIEKYFLSHYSCSDEDNAFLNSVEDFIWDCVVDCNYAKQNIDKIASLSKNVKCKMDNYYITDGGCTARQLLYQEKYYKLRTIYQKVIDEDDTEPLAMLCFASTYHYFWESQINSANVSV